MATVMLRKLILISMLIVEITGDNSVEIDRIMPAYAVAENFDLLTMKSPCREHLKIFKSGVDARKLWSLRMLDASGQPNPGFIHGNGFWLGIESQCLEIMNTKPLALHPKFLKNTTFYRKPEEAIVPYEVNYFSAYFSHNSTLQYQHRVPTEGFITLGLCLPASCSVDELALILRRISSKRTLSVSSIYDIDLTLLSVMVLKTDYRFLMNWRAIAVSLIVIFTSLMIIAGTWYDLCVHQKRAQRAQLPASSNNNFQEKGGIEGTAAGSVLMCFSAYTNSKNIFDLSRSEGPTACLHGLRVTGMSILIALHGGFFTIDRLDNMIELIRLNENILVQIITIGAFPVDTFFFMSGFLVAYAFFRNRMTERKVETTEKFRFQELFEAVVKRFFRLTPIYIVAIGVTEILGGYFAETSQFQRFEKPQIQCPKYWWRNLLYIHNFFDYKEMCLSWSWYLSDDMQFFIAANVILLMSIKYPRTAIGIVIAMLISSIMITGYSAYAYNYIPTLDEFIPSLRILYFPPWARIGPYLVGLATGYMIVKMKDKLSFSKKVVWFLWIVSVISLSLVQFGLYERQISVLSASIYGALSRTVWSLGIAWIVTACCTNNAGPVNRILAAKLWLPFSKLTYAAYLFNPIVIVSANAVSETAFRLNILPLVITAITYLVITYICSYVMSLMFEIPYTLLTKHYFDQRKNK